MAFRTLHIVRSWKAVHGTEPYHTTRCMVYHSRGRTGGAEPIRV